MKANRTSVVSLLLLMVGCVFIIAAATLGASTQTTKQTKTNQSNQTAAVTEALKASFGSALEAVTAFNPFYLTGDFNGDGAQDIVIAARIKGHRSDLPPDVKVYNPFERPKAVFPADPLANPTVALAIIHGSRPGWQTPPALEKFLLFGESPVLILNHGRVTSGDPNAVKNLMELSRKGSRRLRNLGWPAAAAKGDSIVLGTEATDSILYWNGKTYRWEEAAGGE